MMSLVTTDDGCSYTEQVIIVDESDLDLEAQSFATY